VALSGAILFPSVVTMIRPCLVGSIAMLLVISTSFVSDAAPPTKKAKRGQSKVLEVGDEVIFKLLGDETKGNPKLDKVGLIREHSMMLPATPGEGGYTYALGTADRVGFDEMIGRGKIIPLADGTRLTVLEIRRINPSSPFAGRSFLHDYIPASRPDGTCRVRIVDGPHAKKLCDVPLRNLAQPPNEAKDEAKKN
jgi:hypothetical protein